MIKKMLGCAFFVFAALIVIGGVANGTLFKDTGGSAAEMYGRDAGMLIPVVLYILSGIFLLKFESVLKLSYIEGFKKRSKQSKIIYTFAIIYFILLLFVAIGIFVSDFWIEEFLVYMLAYVLRVLPYFVPFMVFFCMSLIYSRPHGACKKYFIKNEEMLNEYLANSQSYKACSADGFVLANDKALFFPKLFCAVPFDQIESLKLKKELWEQDVYFNLTNGKKFYIVTKHYNAIVKAVEDNKK